MGSLPRRSGFLHGLHQRLEAGAHAAVGQVDGGDAQAEVGRHLFARLVLHGALPEGLPGNGADVLANLLARPGEDALLPLGLPRLRCWMLLQCDRGRGVAAAGRTQPLGAPPVGDAAALTLKFLARLRGERKFESPDALKARILFDARAAGRYFRRSKAICRPGIS